MNRLLEALTRLPPEGYNAGGRGTPATAFPGDLLRGLLIGLLRGLLGQRFG